ncbi:MAG: tripartite tricarboxylate transporter substrate binding protein [Proteobacteria bacterium]|nr:tripartite tricarboxylate transporter substrate binding protein [Pseudomonadota bacterium]
MKGKTLNTGVVVFATIAALTHGITPAAAQAYPSKPIRMVVPFPAGGGIDTVARVIAPKLAESLGQPVIIDNRVGASGTVGTEAVAKAAPDGYTLLATFASHAQNASLYPKLGYDTVKDFAPITLIATVPNILVINPSLPVKTVKELVALAKKHPDEILYASIGNGTPAHLSAELFNSMAGIRMTHVPYKGAAASIVALISGETQLTFTTVLVAMPHIKSGRLRALGVASLKRSTVLPDVPTIDEAGVRGYESNAWYGLLAPARTPQPILDQLHRETVKTLQNNDVRDNLKGQGAEPVGNAPREFAVIIADEIEKWRRVVLATGARAD